MGALPNDWEYMKAMLQLFHCFASCSHHWIFYYYYCCYFHSMYYFGNTLFVLFYKIIYQLRGVPLNHYTIESEITSNKDEFNKEK